VYVVAVHPGRPRLLEASCGEGRREWRRSRRRIFRGEERADGGGHRQGRKQGREEMMWHAVGEYVGGGSRRTSRIMDLYEGPNSCLAQARMVEVLPVPGGP